MNKKFFKSKEYSIAEDVLSLMVSVAIFVYLLIGFVAKVWHPTWLVFVGAGIVSIIAFFFSYAKYRKTPILDDNVLPFNKQFESTFVYAKSVKVSGTLFILTIILYVVLSSITGWWHPLWLSFMVMAVIEQTIALVFKLKYKDYKTTAEPVEICSEPVAQDDK